MDTSRYRYMVDRLNAAQSVILQNWGVAEDPRNRRAQAEIEANNNEQVSSYNYCNK